MRVRTISLIFIPLLMIACSSKNGRTTEEKDIDKLLSRMSLEEKVGQLCCPIGFNFYEKQGDSVWLSESFKAMMDTLPLGSCWAVLRADPWSQKTVETGLQPCQSARLLNEMQRYAKEHTPSGIPLLFCEETPHGHMAVGTTVFPTGLGQASTWDTALLKKMGETMGEELRLQGAQVGFGPVLDIAREPRWSRMEETLGEDPYLSGQLGFAIVEGMQTHVVATLKHLAAYGIPRGGHNAANADVGANALMADYLPAFETTVSHGAGAVMTSYNTIDGVPCSANGWLIDDVLRKTWHFHGLVISDLNAIWALCATHHICATQEEAAALALKAGVDIDLGGANYGGFLIKALNAGLVTQSDIDAAVKRVLTVKYDLGLFDNPYVDENKAAERVGNDENVSLALQVARESVVLLKNDGILPFGDDVRRIAVIGPNADNMYNQLGDYTAPQDSLRVVTMLEGISDKNRADVTYVKGCSVRDVSDADIDAAVVAAKSADVAVVVVGGSSARDFKTSYESTGAAIVNDRLSDMECGEGFDRCSLDLLGKQNELLQRVMDCGKPVVVVYVEGRPLLKNLAFDKAAAIVEMWYPGMQGGNALADVLWGDYNPAGRLPVSIPKSVGQIPVCYSQPVTGDYVEGDAKPLFAFGHGLSYTSFKYDNLVVEKAGSDDIFYKVSLKVSNVGDRDGDEVVQLYVRDEVASVVSSSMALKGFARIFIPKGEDKQVSFVLSRRDLSVYNAAQGWHLEHGDFSIMVGAASDDIRLQRKITVE